MLCKKCGLELKDGAKFCLRCGALTNENNTKTANSVAGKIQSIPRTACVYKVGRNVPNSKKGLTWNGLRGSIEMSDDCLKVFQGGVFATGISTGVLMNNMAAYKIPKDQISNASLVSEPQILIIQFKNKQIAISCDESILRMLDAWING